MLFQLVYHSLYQPGDLTKLQVLREILETSRQNNSEQNITGFLIFDGVWFIQILEGPEAAVRETYKRIEKDPRHSASVVVSTRYTIKRTFPVWSMGGSMRTDEARDIYLEHGVGSTLDPRKMRPVDIVSLAADLQNFEEKARSSARGRRA